MWAISGQRMRNRSDNVSPPAKAALFPTYTSLFPSAVILEVCVPDGRVQDGVGPSNPHWTEIYGRNKVSGKPTIFGAF